MDTKRTFGSAPAFRGCCLALGAFDGLHLGHAALLRRMVGAARRLRVPAVVVTFAVPPRLVIHPGTAPGMLLHPARKRRLLAGLGVDAVFELRLTPRLRNLSAEEFLRDYLLRLHPAAVFAGPYVSFGRDRAGDLLLLKRFFSRHSARVVSLAPVRAADGRPVSSSLIRGEIRSGRLQNARLMLGRPYALYGPVQRGEGYAGRVLCVPTANIDFGLQILPPPGVYAVFADCARRRYPAVCNIGWGETPKVEAHLFDAAPDLYGRHLGLEFVGKVRDEVRFSGPEEEKRTIRADLSRAREMLGL